MKTVEKKEMKEPELKIQREEKIIFGPPWCQKKCCQTITFFSRKFQARGKLSKSKS